MLQGNFQKLKDFKYSEQLFFLLLLVALSFGRSVLCSHLQGKKYVFLLFFFFFFLLFLVVPGLQNEQKRFQLEELRKFGAQFKVRKV